MTRADRIRYYSSRGFNPSEVAEMLEITRKTVLGQLWKDQRPGYKAKWMANHRKNNPEYYKRELQQQREYDRRRRAERRT